MPAAFLSSGLALGIAATIFVSLICTHCSYILVSSGLSGLDYEIMSDYFNLGGFCTRTVQTEAGECDEFRGRGGGVLQDGAPIRERLRTDRTADRPNRNLRNILHNLQLLFGYCGKELHLCSGKLHGITDQHSDGDCAAINSFDSVGVCAEFEVFSPRFDGGERVHGYWVGDHVLLLGGRYTVDTRTKTGRRYPNVSDFLQYYSVRD